METYGLDRNLNLMQRYVVAWQVEKSVHRAISPRS